MATGDVNFVRPAVAAAHFGVDSVTLRRWASEGFIRAIQLPGPKGSGHRRYDITSMHPRASTQAPKLEAKVKEVVGVSEDVPRARVGYCRVSSIKQRDELNRQVEELRSIQPPFDEIITDIGSSLNYKRQNFQRLLIRVSQGGVSNVTVTCRDRFCRFGIELVEHILSSHNCSLSVLHEVPETSDEPELARDLMEIVHLFASGSNSSRRRPAKTSTQTYQEQRSFPGSGNSRESEDLSSPIEDGEEER